MKLVLFKNRRNKISRKKETLKTEVGHESYGRNKLHCPPTHENLVGLLLDTT